MNHEYAITSDCERVQLPTFYPDSSHYIYHDPQAFSSQYGAGVAVMRDMQFDGTTPRENLRGLDQVTPANQPLQKPPVVVVSQSVDAPLQQPVKTVVPSKSAQVSEKPPDAGVVVVETRRNSHQFLFLLAVTVVALLGLGALGSLLFRRGQ